MSGDWKAELVARMVAGKAELEDAEGMLLAELLSGSHKLPRAIAARVAVVAQLRAERAARLAEWDERAAAEA
jgi:hypothetical protein